MVYQSIGCETYVFHFDNFMLDKPEPIKKPKFRTHKLGIKTKLSRKDIYGG